MIQLMSRPVRFRACRTAYVAVLVALATVSWPGIGRAQNGVDYFQEVWARVDMAEPYGNAMGFDPVSQTLAIGRVGGALPDRHVMLYRASDGQPADPPFLSEGATAFSGLGAFSVAGRPDGGFMASVDVPGGLHTWNTIDQATPHVQPWSGLFSRNMDIEGTAPSLTVYSVGSSDGGPITVQTTSDGVTFDQRLTDIGGLAPLPPGGKAGVAASGPHPAEVVIGVESVGGPDLNGAHIYFWNPDSSSYVYHGDFRPFSFEGIVMDGTVDCAIDPAADAAFFLVCANGSSTVPPTEPGLILAVKLSDLGNEVGDVTKEDGTLVEFTVMNVTELGRYPIPGASGVGARGSLALDRANKIAYWYARSNSNLNGFGAVRYGGEVQPPDEPEITGIAAAGPATLRITYQSTAATNTIQATTDLTDPLTWAPVEGSTEPAPGTFEVPVPSSPTMHYYRILAE